MHPSKSIIYFTVFSGTGYGIILCLSFLTLLTDINFDNMFIMKDNNMKDNKQSVDIIKTLY